MTDRQIRRKKEEITVFLLLFLMKWVSLPLCCSFFKTGSLGLHGDLEPEMLLGMNQYEGYAQVHVIFSHYWSWSCISVSPGENAWCYCFYREESNSRQDNIFKASSMRLLSAQFDHCWLCLDSVFKLLIKSSGSLHSSLLGFEQVSKQITCFPCPTIDPNWSREEWNKWRQTQLFVCLFLRLFFQLITLLYKKMYPKIALIHLILGINSQSNILLWQCDSEQQWGTASIYKLLSWIWKQGTSWWALYAQFFSQNDPFSSQSHQYPLEKVVEKCDSSQVLRMVGTKG